MSPSESAPTIRGISRWSISAIRTRYIRHQETAGSGRDAIIEREMLVELWDTAWRDGLWAAPWSKALEGLTPAQAQWKSHPGRHSIWQVVHHVLYWRYVTLRLARGEPEPDPAETERRNWEEPSEANAEAWRETVRRYETSQRELAEALKTVDREGERFLYHLFHDNYHIGQIMQLRAMQGLAPIV